MHAGGSVGLLELSGVVNQGPSPELEARMRARFAGASRTDLLELPVMAAYAAYYNQQKKTYHVLLQLQSIVSGSRDLPTVSPLVDANFAAEAQLTAIEEYIRLFSGDAVIEQRRILVA